MIEKTLNIPALVSDDTQSLDNPGAVLVAKMCVDLASEGVRLRRAIVNLKEQIKERDGKIAELKKQIAELAAL